MPDQQAHPSIPTGEIQQRAVKGASLLLITQVGQFVVMAATAIVLARLLTPRDFGLFALVAIVSTTADRVRDFGLPLAVVQQDDLALAQLDDLFRWNLVLTVALSVGIMALGPLLAWFFGEPELFMMSVAVGGAVLIGGLSNIHQGLLRREMRFGALAAIGVAALVAGSGMGVGAALLGAGAWSLVVQYGVILGVRAALSWSWHPWCPSPPLLRFGSGPRVGPVLKQGGQTVAAQFLMDLPQRIDRLLVAWMAGTTILGFYENGARWSNLPLAHFRPSLRSVVVSGLSRLRNQVVPFRQFAHRSFLALLGPVVPALGFVALESELAVRVLFGSQWYEAAFYLRVFALAALADALGGLTVWIYLAEGKNSDRLRWASWSALFTCLGLAVGATFGPRGVAVGYTIATALLVLPSFWVCASVSRLSVRDFVTATVRPVFFTVAAVCSLVLLSPTLPTGDLAHLGTSAAVFAAGYALLWGATAEGRTLLRDIWSTLSAPTLRTPTSHSSVGGGA